MKMLPTIRAFSHFDNSVYPTNTAHKLAQISLNIIDNKT